MFWNAIEKVKGYAFLWIIVCLGFLFFSPSYVFAQTNPYVGKWGYTVLGHGGSWYKWKTEAGTITFNSDWTPTTPGTVTSTYMESADTCPSANYCKSSDTQNHTYTINADGTATLDGVVKFVISDNKKVIIGDGTSFPEGQMLMVAVKMDPTHPYTLSDVTGDYYMGGYEYDATGGNKGYYRVHSLISTMNNGIVVMNGTINGDGAIIPVSNKQGSCSINTDGSMLLNGAITGYAGDGSLAVFSNPRGGTNNDFASYIALKKADRQYSTADLQGTWVMAAFGDDRKTLFSSEFGTITCDGAGNCSVSLKKKNSNGTNTYYS